MKISKLFHWLYALVMLLPIFAIGTSCLISTFNMSGKEETEIVYKYETNEVNSASDLIEGRIYHWRFQLTNDTSFQNLAIFKDIYNINGYADTIIDTESTTQYNLRLYQINMNVGIYLSNGESTAQINRLPNDIFECDVVYKGINYLDNWENYTISTYNVLKSIETHNLNAEEVFYNAIDKVQQSPLFNWSYDSFLVTPFAYIVNLFSMPTNSFVVMLLSYWLSISIIWLVFDLIMYVPLLVHRWLDKGVLE